MLWVYIENNKGEHMVKCTAVDQAEADREIAKLVKKLNTRFFVVQKSDHSVVYRLACSGFTMASKG